MSVAPQVRRKIRLVDFYRDRCAKSTAHKWINQGRLKAYKLGRMTFVDESFDEFVERQAKLEAASAQAPPEPLPQPGQQQPTKRSRGRPPGSRNATAREGSDQRNGSLWLAAASE